MTDTYQVIKTQHCPNCEATEQKLHDLRQEVSDIVDAYVRLNGFNDWDRLINLIIPKPMPDPLVKAMEKMGWYIAPNGPTDAENFRAALDALGFEIREKGQ